MMNRRELFAAMAATAVVGDAFALGEQSPNTTPVMGSRVFDWNSVPDKPNAHGSVRSFFSSPTATLENLELHVTTLNPGESPHAPHKHPNEELIIIRQGTVETLSNGSWVRVGPGSAIFNGSNQLHGFKNVGSEPAVYHVINFKTAATPAA